jgi:hypothetical protein
MPGRVAKSEEEAARPSAHNVIQRFGCFLSTFLFRGSPSRFTRFFAI